MAGVMAIKFLSSCAVLQAQSPKMSEYFVFVLIIFSLGEGIFEIAW